MPVALHFAAQRRVLPEVMLGRGIGGVSYTTLAEVWAGRALAELRADLIQDHRVTVSIASAFPTDTLATTGVSTKVQSADPSGSWW